MDTSFVNKMNLNEQWLVFKQMLDEKRYEETGDMVAQGYTVTAALLDVLHRLDREDIIDRICRLPFKYDETAKAFLGSYYGDEATEKILERIKRQNLKAQEELAKAKKEEQQEQLESMFYLGFSQKILEYAEKHGVWKAVIDRFGESVIYQGIQSCPEKYKNAKQYFSLDFLSARGDLSKSRIESLFLKEGFDDVVFAKVAKYPNGAKAIYDVGLGIGTDWLIENGYKSLFYADGSAGFERLANADKIDDDDWKKWYVIDKEAALCYANYTQNVHAMKLLKQRMWLLSQGYVWEALIC